MADYRFYSKKQYFSHLAVRLAAARHGDRILLMSMTFDPDEAEVAQIMASLLIAAQNGADVVFGIDAMSFMGKNGKPGSDIGPLLLHRSLPAKLSAPYDLKRNNIDKIAAFSNVTTVITNRPQHRLSLRIAGRSHIKAAIINDEVLLGGCNLDYPDNIDLMVGFQDASLADSLYGQLRDGLHDGIMRRSLAGTDAEFIIDSTTRVLIDAGVSGQSAIFKQSLRLIDQAQEWLVITCQFFPNGVTAQHLLAAYKRGVKVTILYPPLSRLRASDRPLQFFSRCVEHGRLPLQLFKDRLPTSQPFIHAKVITCDQGMMIGSHNYVSPGVQLGTAEIALYSRDSELATQALTAIKNLI